MATPFRLKRSSVQGKRPALTDLQTGELALNTNDGFLFATRDTSGVGIGTTVALLTPWTENFGGGSIFYANSVGIGITNPSTKLDVDGEITIRRTDAGSEGGQVNFARASDNTVAYSIDVFGNTASNARLRFIDNVAGAERATIDRSGNFIIGSGSSTGTISQALQINSGAFISGLVGIATTNPTSRLHVIGDALVSGVVTATTFVGALTGIAASATKLVTPRTFEITGDVVASAISFDGTGNVSLAATIQPNSVALGGDTTGDYVQTITGTSNQITVTSGTGESSTPTLSIPNQFTAPQDVTVTRDLQVDRNLNVNGNITIGGTSATLFTTELKISDPDIVLGFRTDAFGNDISTDNTANHGGVAIASTEGTPLVQLFIAGIETNPATYKKIMWFKSGTFSGLGTDAWLSNYAVGIGSTQFPTGTRLAAGNVQFTENDLAVVRNINSSGVITATGGIQGIGIQSGSVNIATGIITALNFVGSGNTFSYNSTTKTVDINIGGSQWSFTDTSNTLTSNIFRLNGNVGLGTTNPTSKLHVVGDALITGFTTLGTGATTTSTLFTNQLSVAGVSTYIGIATFLSTLFTNQLSVSGVSTFTGISTFQSTLFTNQLSVSGVSTFAGISTFQSTLFTNQLSVSGVSTFNNNIIQLSGSIGIATPNPTSKLHVVGDALITGVLTAVNGIRGIGIQSGGVSITTGIITTLNFVGSAVSTITNTNGLVEINVKSGQFSRSTTSFTATAGQTTFSVTYTPNFIDVFLNGVRLTAAEFTATNGTSVVLSEGANAGDTIDVVVFQNSGLFDSSKWTAADLSNPVSGNIYKLNGNVGIATTNPTSKLHIVGDALVSGIVTATGGFNIGIQSAGTNITTGVVTAFNFIGAGNSFTYNAGTKIVDINIGGAQWTYADTTNTTTSNIYRLNGNVGIATTNPIDRFDVLGILGIGGTITGITTTDPTTIDTLPITTYRSARFQVQITQSTDYQSTDLMVIHNGTTSNIIEYGSIATNDYLASFTSEISGSSLLLQATMGSAGIATVKVVRYGVTV